MIGQRTLLGHGCSHAHYADHTRLIVTLLHGMHQKRDFSLFRAAANPRQLHRALPNLRDNDSALSLQAMRPIQHGVRKDTHVVADVRVLDAQQARRDWEIGRVVARSALFIVAAVLGQQLCNSLGSLGE